MEPDRWEPLVYQASLAPSSHNTQPWRFVIRGGRLQIHTDRTRALPVNDPDDRELTISCAAALFNLLAAAAAADLRATAEVAGDPTAGLIATVACEPGAPLLPVALAGAISLRYTVREPFATGSLEPELLEHLAGAAAAEGASLHWLDGRATREQVADLVAEGDRIQFADRRWRRELAAWMHPGRDDDGLPLEHFGGAVRFVLSRFNVGGSTAGKDEVFALRAPALAVLTTPADDAPAWIAAGRALERVLLTAAAAGIQAGYLNQPCQIQDLRRRLQVLAGIEGFPQIVLRLGRHPGPPPQRRRRPIGEILTLAG